MWINGPKVGKTVLYLDHAVMNRGVLLLPQHHQGNDNDSCYNNTSHHKSNDGTFVGANILSEKHLPGQATQLCDKPQIHNSQ